MIMFARSNVASSCITLGLFRTVANMKMDTWSILLRKSVSFSGSIDQPRLYTHPTTGLLGVCGGQGVDVSHVSRHSFFKLLYEVPRGHRFHTNMHAGSGLNSVIDLRAIIFDVIDG